TQSPAQENLAQTFFPDLNSLPSTRPSSACPSFPGGPARTPPPALDRSLSHASSPARPLRPHPTHVRPILARSPRSPPQSHTACHLGPHVSQPSLTARASPLSSSR